MFCSGEAAATTAFRLHNSTTANAMACRVRVRNLDFSFSLLLRIFLVLCVPEELDEAIERVGSIASKILVPLQAENSGEEPHLHDGMLGKPTTCTEGTTHC